MNKFSSVFLTDYCTPWNQNVQRESSVLTVRFAHHGEVRCDTFLAANALGLYKASTLQTEIIQICILNQIECVQEDTLLP